MRNLNKKKGTEKSSNKNKSTKTPEIIRIVGSFKISGPDVVTGKNNRIWHAVLSFCYLYVQYVPVEVLVLIEGYPSELIQIVDALKFIEPTRLTFTPSS